MNNKIQKITATAMVVLGLALTSQVNAGWWSNSTSSASDEVKADYVWDNSKSYFLNSILEAGIDDDNYKKDWTKQSFVDEFGTEIFTKDFQDKSSGVLGSLWWLGTGGLDGLMISQASGKNPFRTQYSAFSFAKLDKSEFATKEDVVNALKEDFGLSFYKSDVQEYETYWSFRKTTASRPKEYIYIQERQFKHLKFIMAEDTFIKQPHLLENGKIHLPIKPIE